METPKDNESPNFFALYFNSVMGSFIYSLLVKLLYYFKKYKI